METDPGIVSLGDAQPMFSGWRPRPFGLSHWGSWPRF
jgi:hypothetical protein